MILKFVKYNSEHVKNLSLHRTHEHPLPYEFIFSVFLGHVCGRVCKTEAVQMKPSYDLFLCPSRLYFVGVF